MLSTLSTVLITLLLFNVLMFTLQPSMIFIPFKHLDATPKAWGLAYEDVTLNTRDGEKLHGWYIPHEGAKRTLLFFHGNAGNISHRGDSILIFHRLGFNVFIFDYRGYGQSTGKPTEKGLYIDASTAWDYLIKEKSLAPEDVVIFGRSLGGAAALKLATDVKASALILESTFTSVRDFSRSAFPLLTYVTYLRYEFNNLKRIKAVHYPVLILHSPEDDIVPYQLGEKLYQAANEPKTFINLQGDHNTGFLLSQPRYENALKEFLSTCCESGKLLQ